MPVVGEHNCDAALIGILFNRISDGMPNYRLETLPVNCQSERQITIHSH